jgi:hypothetical protein
MWNPGLWQKLPVEALTRPIPKPPTGSYSNKLIVNIIFSTGEIKHLRLFTLTLLKWLPCSFRLVANGCDKEEIRLLEDLCKHDSRLELLIPPFAQKAKHHDVLNYLQKQETSAYFCIMDADIFAAADFLSPFLPHIGNYTAFFSGRPVWQEKAESILPPGNRRIMGRYITSTTGTMLGCSYFAIYNNDRLSEFIEHTGLTFNQLHWQNIPLVYQKELEAFGLKADFYDTGKVLHIIMGVQGERFLYKEPPGLYHLGGYSSLIPGHAQPVPPPSSAKLTPTQALLVQKLHQQVAASNSENRWRLSKDTLRKRKITGFFIALLDALFADKPLPETPQIDSAGIMGHLKYMKVELLDYYHTFKEQLR